MMMKIWVVGSGPMAEAYVKVLKAMHADFLVIGRGEASARKCEEATGCPVIQGGLSVFLADQPPACAHAIVCVGVEALADSTAHLLRYGVRSILVEKPAGLNAAQIEAIADLCRTQDASVHVAYNRRFFASVLKAQEIIQQDGGVTSFNFEFTEWAHVIEKMTKGEGVLAHWFLANSTHVVDLAFYLGGRPKELFCSTAGSLAWHPSASVFAGSGVSEGGALFSYQANWESAGRWCVEVLTRHHRLILRPMEKLQIQKKGSVDAHFVECDASLDEQFKPGLFLQTQQFLRGVDTGLCHIDEQSALMASYGRIAGYKFGSSN